MSAVPAISRRKEWTEQELQALPDNGFDYEVVDGELVMRPETFFAASSASFLRAGINPSYYS